MPWRRLAGGLLLFTIECARIYLGLQHTTVARLTIFLYCDPFWLAAILPLLVRAERPSAAQLAGSVLAFVGFVLTVARCTTSTLAAMDW